jgi:hypothetical protein
MPDKCPAGSRVALQDIEDSIGHASLREDLEQFEAAHRVVSDGLKTIAFPQASAGADSQQASCSG